MALKSIRESFKEKRVTYRRFAGMFLAILVVLAFVGCLSYLFSWREDQSVLTSAEPVDASVVENHGSKLGLSLSALLVGRWFGLGAFAVIFAFGILSARMIFGKLKCPVIKWVILSVTGGFLLSYVLAYFSSVFGLENSFGGGLGGECGAYAVAWLKGMVGGVVSFLVLALLCVVWLFFASRRFSNWMSNEGARTKRQESEVNGQGSMDDGQESDVNGQRSMVDGQESKEDGQWSMDDGQEFDVNGQGSMVDGQESDVNGQWSMVGGQESEDDGQWSMDEGLEGDEEGEEAGEVEVSGSGDDDNLRPIEIHDELSKYQMPPLSLLGDYSDKIHKVGEDELRRNKLTISNTLRTYKIGVKRIDAVVGPTVTLYKVFQSEGVKVAQIQSLNNEIAMALNTKFIRISILPDSVGIEVPNAEPSIVTSKSVFSSAEFKESRAELPIAIGVAMNQKVKVFDLAASPHLLVGGATMQGKSVGLNTMIASLLYSKHPTEVKFVFVDPKRVEFPSYRKLIYHYLAVLPDAGSEADEKASSIITSPERAERVLSSLCTEMDDRYGLMESAGVNKVTDYNKKYCSRHLLPTEGHRYLPYLVVIIDEYADLTMAAASDDKSRSRNISAAIVRLAQKGRACGIHVVIATQRPSVDIITGTIKSQFPTRIAFKVAQNQDSRTILDAPGAEKLTGRGDMFFSTSVDMDRIQCAYIDSREVDAICEYIGNQSGYKKSFNIPYYLPEPKASQEESQSGGLNSLSGKALDSMFDDAARLVVGAQKGSVTDLQRKLGIGFGRAGRIMDSLEEAGIVGPPDGSKPRKVLISDLDDLESILLSLKKI